jgi:hypothetical protein
VNIYDLLTASFKSELGSVIRWGTLAVAARPVAGVSEGTEGNGEILPHK